MSFYKHNKFKSLIPSNLNHDKYVETNFENNKIRELGK